MATDLAEVIGGAIALHLLFDLPLLLGGLITGPSRCCCCWCRTAAVSTRSSGSSPDCCWSSRSASSPDCSSRRPRSGSSPAWCRFDGLRPVLLATAMLGATVMPHAVYLHSASPGTGSATPAGPDGAAAARHPHDVGLAMVLAGAVNLSMLLLAASDLRGARHRLDPGAHAAVADAGPDVGLLFAMGLLASGLASTSVGAYAGA